MKENKELNNLPEQKIKKKFIFDFGNNPSSTKCINCGKDVENHPSLFCIMDVKQD